MNVRSLGMEFATEMIVNAAKANLRIAEVPTRLRRDGRDRAPHLRSFRDGWRHLRFILTYAPDYLYLVPGAMMLLPGLALEALLAGGPITAHGAYLGIHFLALGSLLTLVGFNVINLGVLAKTLMAQRYSGIKSRTVRIVSQKLSLESGLITGVVLTLLGAALDVTIITKWVAEFGSPMEATVHLAFVATTALVLGLNLICSSFLLNLILVEGAPTPSR